MLTVICIVLAAACAVSCTARIWERKKVDFVSGLCAAACFGAVIGLMIYKFI